MVAPVKEFPISDRLDLTPLVFSIICLVFWCLSTMATSMIFVFFWTCSCLTSASFPTRPHTDSRLRLAGDVTASALCVNTLTGEFPNLKVSYQEIRNNRPRSRTSVARGFPYRLATRQAVVNFAGVCWLCSRGNWDKVRVFCSFLGVANKVGFCFSFRKGANVIGAPHSSASTTPLLLLLLVTPKNHAPAKVSHSSAPPPLTCHPLEASFPHWHVSPHWRVPLPIFAAVFGHTLAARFSRRIDTNSASCSSLVPVWLSVPFPPVHGDVFELLVDSVVFSGSVVRKNEQEHFVPSVHPTQTWETN